MNAKQRAAFFRKVKQRLSDPSLPAEDRAAVEEELRAYEALVADNPLIEFEPHSDPQREWFEASTPVQAAFAGNAFGKTAGLVVKCLIQHAPEQSLPRELAPYKLVRERPVRGRLLVPSEKAMIDYTIPEFQKWTPKHMYLGGSWEKAWDKQHNILRFSGDCGQIGVYTYKQDPEDMEGSKLAYIAYDEPPPEPIRKACLGRLLKSVGGFEMFALTPVNKGGGIGWLYREIWKQREHPDTTVVQASIHDNPLLSAPDVGRILNVYGAPGDPEREAREFGRFMHFGGMVYAGGFEHVLIDPPAPEQVRALDTVVGMDPGLKNAAFVWTGFDSDNHAFVYDELLLQDKHPIDYALAIARVNARWGLDNTEIERALLESINEFATAGVRIEITQEQVRREFDTIRTRGPVPSYVIDPQSAAVRGLTSQAGSATVEDELRRCGIFPLKAKNSVQLGIQNIRRRIGSGAYFVSRECRGLRDEADEYRAEDRDDGEFKVVKENDHRLDAARYAVMQRPWAGFVEQTTRRLGYQQDYEPAYEPEYVYDSPPQGAIA